jgi:pSer/pThr/pTyr-binding forkhead associated (FHA) protein
MVLVQLLAQLFWRFRELSMTIQKIINIGRSIKSDYRIDREVISNDHAMLIVSDKEKFLLIDCDSTNGTRLLSHSGADSVTQTEVQAGSIVFFGHEKREIRDIVENNTSSHSFSADEKFTRFRDAVDGSIKSKPR